MKHTLTLLAALLLTPLAALHAAEVPASAAAAPANTTELKTRMAELRLQYAPFLESRPGVVSLRRRQDLCGNDWLSRFEVKRVSDKPAKAMTPRPDLPGWEKVDLDVAGWERTSVPEWRYDGLPKRQPASCILWYRKTFTAKKPAGRERVFLVFEGVDWEAEMWLNGKRLGNHSVYFEPFRFDVTEVITANNTLAVRVIDGPQFGEPAAFWSVFPVPPATEQRYVRDRARSLAGLQKGDTLIGSGYGIHREVYLETAAPAVITEVQARGYPAKREAVVHVGTDVAGEKPSALKVELLPENFEGESFSRRVDFAPAAAGGQTVVVPMPDAHRWSPGTPWLYRCRVSLLDDAGRAVDTRDAVFGHRTVELVSEPCPRAGLQPGTLLLDGEPLFLRGANIQGLNAFWLWGERDKLLDVLLLLKAADFNAVRCCQHVAFPEVRELLDRLGIMSEQDVGSRYPHLGEQVRPGLLAASAAIARDCYNNPGVVLLSFANETDFDPTDMLRAALAVDPDRLFNPISGHPLGGTVRPNEGRSGYSLTDDLWARVIDDVHPYWGWYGFVGRVSQFCQLLPPDRMVTVGEYGSEALDSYETMARYPADWGPRPAKDADELWGHVQVVKNDVRQQVGLRGRQPANLGDYIAASQNYQYDQLAEVTKTWRLSARRVAGYFQFHFIDVLPANWPKSIVSHDLTPKRGYFAMAQVNQPLVPLPRLIRNGHAMELWAANDLPQAHRGCRIRWQVRREDKTLADGTQPVDVPASDAVLAGVADLSALPKDAEVVELRLTLESRDGRRLASYTQEAYLPAWVARDVTAKLREKTATWVEAETAGTGEGLQIDSTKADTTSNGQNLAVHADRHPALAAQWTFTLAAALGKAELLVRHAHEKPVTIRLRVAGTAVGAATLEPTGGWGYKDSDWAWSAIPLPGTLTPGNVKVQIEFLNRTPLNLDCLAMAASASARSPKTRSVALTQEKPVAVKPKATAGGFPVYGSFEEMLHATEATLPPVRTVTRGPKFHWFGYYDKFQLDVTGRYLLSMEVDFENRLPKSNEAIKVGMVDLADGDKWIELGESRAWCWQQGCMLQWRPGSDREVVWNDREGDRFVCRVLDVKTRKLRTLPRAIGTISPDGKTALCEDFSRIWNFRAGYAYAGIPDKYADQPAPADIGVWRMDMETGDSRQIISLANLVKIPYPKQASTNRHYVNHLSWSPDGKRFLMFNRWSGAGADTRVFTADADGQELRVLSASGASHWTWREPGNVLIWNGGYKLYKDDGTGIPKEELWKAPNGHQTYVPGTNNKWLVTDTYPYGTNRDQVLYLYHVPTGGFVLLGRFPSTYSGEWRCDTHPRVSRDGRLVIIDSPHGGNGRQQYIVDISKIIFCNETCRPTQQPSAATWKATPNVLNTLPVERRLQGVIDSAFDAKRETIWVRHRTSGYRLELSLNAKTTIDRDVQIDIDEVPEGQPIVMWGLDPKKKAVRGIFGRIIDENKKTKFGVDGGALTARIHRADPVAVNLKSILSRDGKTLFLLKEGGSLWTLPSTVARTTVMRKEPGAPADLLAGRDIDIRYRMKDGNAELVDATVKILFPGGPPYYMNPLGGPGPVTVTEIEKGVTDTLAQYEKRKDELARLMPVKMTLEPALAKVGEPVTLKISALAGKEPNRTVQLIRAYLATPSSPTEELVLNWKRVEGTSQGLTRYHAELAVPELTPGQHLIKWVCDIGGDIPEYWRSLAVVDDATTICMFQINHYTPDLKELFDTHKLPHFYWSSTPTRFAQWTNAVATAKTWADISRRDRQFGFEAEFALHYYPPGTVSAQVREDPPDVQRAGLRAVKTIAPLLGFTAPAISFYNYGMGSETMRIARGEGFRAISSLCTENHVDGNMGINHYGHPERPYFISPEDFRKAGPGGAEGMVGFSQVQRHTWLARMFMCGYCIEPGADIAGGREVWDELTFSRLLDFYDALFQVQSSQKVPFVIQQCLEFSGSRPGTAEGNRMMVDYAIRKAKQSKVVFATVRSVGDYYRRHYRETPETTMYFQDYWAGYHNRQKPDLFHDVMEIENHLFTAMFKQDDILPAYHYDYTRKWDYPDFGNEAIPRRRDGYGYPDPEDHDKYAVTPRITDARKMQASRADSPTGKGLLIRLTVVSDLPRQQFPLAIWNIPREWHPGVDWFKVGDGARFAPVKAPYTENLNGFLICDLKAGENEFTLEIDTPPRQVETQGIKVGDVLGKTFDRGGRSITYLWPAVPWETSFTLTVPTGREVGLTISPKGELQQLSAGVHRIGIPMEQFARIIGPTQKELCGMLSVQEPVGHSPTAPKPPTSSAAPTATAGRWKR